MSEGTDREAASKKAATSKGEGARGAVTPLSASEVEANDQLIGIGAPVLIGFGVTLIGLVVANESQMRWPGPVVVALMLSTLALVFMMRVYLRGRPHILTEEEIVKQVPYGSAENRRLTKEMQDGAFRRWTARARLLFDAGISLLLLGAAGVMLPPGPLDEINEFRLAAVAIALIGFVGEAYWVIGEAVRERGSVRAQKELEQLVCQSRPDPGAGTIADPPEGDAEAQAGAAAAAASSRSSSARLRPAAKSSTSSIES